MTELIKTHRYTIVNVIAGIIGMLCLTVIIRIFWFNTRFFPNTVIEGVDCSRLEPAAAAELVKDSLAERRVVISGARGETLAARDLIDLLGGDEEIEAQLEQLFALQHDQRRLGALTSGTYTYRLGRPSREVLIELLYEVGDYGYLDAQDAYLYVGDGEWGIEPAVAGTRPDPATCFQALSQRLAAEVLCAGSGAITVELPLLTVGPTVNENDTQLRMWLYALETVLDTDITLDFGGGITHRLTRQELSQVYTVTAGEDGVVIGYDPSGLKEMLDGAIEVAGGDGVARKYGPIGREELHYNEWDKGFILDREALYQGVDALLAAKSAGVVTAEYDYTSSVSEAYGFGNTFIEISIENQYVWYYKNGALIVETPVVTGCIATGDETNTGVFQVYGRYRNAYLSGGNTNTGPGYRVKYWIPFDGNIGLHDADWVTEFGGDIYLENGSHGCVNTPEAAMERIYVNCAKGCDVVVY